MLVLPPGRSTDGEERNTDESERRRTGLMTSVTSSQPLSRVTQKPPCCNRKILQMQTHHHKKHQHVLKMTIKPLQYLNSPIYLLPRYPPRSP
ncbi:uncharacterized protein ACO6RY_03655 [Pungitius sinensis]